MISATLKIKVPDHRRAEVLQMLECAVESTRAEPGCVSCHTYQDLQTEDAIFLEEVWESRADLDRHIRSDRYRYILAVMDIATEAPEVTFNTISPMGGMQIIRAARK